MHRTIIDSRGSKENGRAQQRVIPREMSVGMEANIAIVMVKVSCKFKMKKNCKADW